MTKDEIVDTWLDAEEELRNENEEKCLEMREKSLKELDKLSDEDKQYCLDYLDSCGA